MGRTGRSFAVAMLVVVLGFGVVFSATTVALIAYHESPTAQDKQDSHADKTESDKPREVHKEKFDG